MSVAEKLIAQRLAQGFPQGLWMGKIQALEEFLGQAVSPREELEAFEIAELERRHASLLRELQGTF
jgi:hypothetical protein